MQRNFVYSYIWILFHEFSKHNKNFFHLNTQNNLKTTHLYDKNSIKIKMYMSTLNGAKLHF